MRRIFGDYAGGRSMKAIAHRLNVDGIPFPAKDTKRGPARRGWAVSTIQVLLHNEKYAGLWVWNRTKFLKDPDTGRRRPVERPPDEWIRQERLDLRIIAPELWASVQARLAFVRDAFGCGDGGLFRGRASAAYSPRLLSGFLTCSQCGTRMVGQTFTRKKNGRIYRYQTYRCGFAATKGSAVCSHGTAYRGDRLEAGLLAHFRAAMTPEMVGTLVASVNARAAVLAQRRDVRLGELKEEIMRLERQAGNLVRFVAEGGPTGLVREELAAIEAALAGLRAELVEADRAHGALLPRADRVWVSGTLERLDALLRGDITRARVEIAKHLDGPLVVSPKLGRLVSGGWRCLAA